MSIGSNNGKYRGHARRVYATAASYTKRAWLRDNRELLAGITTWRRYDRAAEMWIGRSDRWQSQVMQAVVDTKMLPLPEQVGFPAVDDAGRVRVGFQVGAGLVGNPPLSLRRVSGGCLPRTSGQMSLLSARRPHGGGPQTLFRRLRSANLARTASGNEPHSSGNSTLGSRNLISNNVFLA